MSRIFRRFQYHLKLFGISGLISVLRSKFDRRQYLLRVKEDSISTPLYVRSRSTDIGVYEQIFWRHEYRFEVKRPPRFIVDAGANIGLTSVYLANRFPDAQILAIEPSESNFALLLKNTALYPNVVPLMAALWGEMAEVDVLDPGLGANGFRVGSTGAATDGAVATGETVSAITIQSILQQYNLHTIDLLKVDIEGAELDVFRHSRAWIDAVDSMVVELHEPFAPGCSRSFYKATAGFDLEWSHGESIYLTRHNGLLQPVQASLIADA